MLLRKPSILLSLNGTSSQWFSPYTSLTCPHCAPAPRPRRKHPEHQFKPRLYATAADTPYIPWPETAHPNVNPSPYEIFHQQRNEPYSKRRFYELVKIYHPDRNQHTGALEDAASANSNAAHDDLPCRCPRPVMLERYRLVIAANTILSDPDKRSAYDHTGAGWPRWKDPDAFNPLKYHPRHGQKWPIDQDPMYNATWEDWERWYRAQYTAARQSANRQSHAGFASEPFSFFHLYAFGGNGTGSGSTGQRQGGVYSTNQAFISLVFVLTALGGMWQATRLSSDERSRIERSNLVNEKSSRMLTQARQDARDRKESGETKGERLRRFVRTREDYDEGEFDGRVLREGDEGFCGSGAANEAEAPRFWEKPPERR